MMESFECSWMVLGQAANTGFRGSDENPCIRGFAALTEIFALEEVTTAETFLLFNNFLNKEIPVV